MKKNSLIIILLIIVSFSSSCQKKFDKKVWLENTNFMNTKNPRIYMVDDIMTNYLKDGMKKEDVIRILGKPSRDSIGGYLPKGVVLPDSLSVINTRNLPKEKQDEYLLLSNEWFKKNYKSAPMLTYYIGWSMIDPVSLEIRLNNKNEVVDFWTKEH